ncbi:RNHCP domain-containing protein [Nocardia panacis]|uniref:RNHCP domain-containing protein n=1 Tax=Nocardia panacis TaxID=2340916 RepID=UPI001EEF7F88|nr:RNHCP domain-containing protein [Nocardia panacis]
MWCGLVVSTCAGARRNDCASCLRSRHASTASQAGAVHACRRCPSRGRFPLRRLLSRCAGARAGHRDHCPNCSTPVHVDRRIPADRRATCRGRMDTVSVTPRPDGEWLVIHQRPACGELGVDLALPVTSTHCG